MSQEQTIRVFVGTDESRRLAETLAEVFAPRLTVAVTLSAGLRPPRGCLVDRVADTTIGSVEAVVDGLDPFALDTIRAVRASTRKAGLPRLAFRPRGWERHPLDRWVEVRDLAGAVNAVASVARTALLWLPPSDVAAFETVGGLRFPTRLSRNPAQWSLPPRFEPCVIPPPYSIAGDTALLRRCQAQAVVMRATGAAADAPLVHAARALDLPIVMIRRPIDRGDVPARSVDVAIDWVDSILNPPDFFRNARELR